MSEKSFRWVDLLGFRKMVAPTLIHLVYWCGGVAIAVMGLGRVFKSFGAGGGIGQALGALLAVVLMLLVWRILCELWILLFSIHDRLGALLDASKKQD